MNRYGEMARDHWRRYRPKAWEALENPTAHFTSLGETVLEEITAREEAYLRANPPPQGFLDRQRAMEQARRIAEETVLSEMVLLPEEETAEP